MVFGERQRVLVVSSSDKASEYIGAHLKNDYCVEYATSGVEARQILLDKDFSVVIINAPLCDEFGTELAEKTVKDSYAGVMILVKADVFNNVSFTMEKIGVYTLSKPLSSATFIQGLTLVRATHERLNALAKKTETLKGKMEEIRLLGRAKLLLITKLSFSEEEAHKYIEKQAMDRCVKKTVVASEIIKTYGN